MTPKKKVVKSSVFKKMYSYVFFTVIRRKKGRWRNIRDAPFGQMTGCVPVLSRRKERQSKQTCAVVYVS